MTQENFPFLVSSPKSFHSKLTLNFHEDPGHGWLEVPLEVLSIFDLTVDDFTGYSYVDSRNGVIYLEEDCDAPKFVKIAGEHGHDIKFDEIYYNDECFIRNL